MRDKLCTLLGIESGEESKVSMLLTQSVFLGIFIGAYDITAYSLLLSAFNEKMMARGFMVSGVAGIFIISLYSWFRTRVQFKNLAIVNLIVVAALTFFLWTAMVLSPARWIIFLVFIMLGPLSIMALLSFWEAADRLFNYSRQKRLFILVESGLITGVIIISFIIPILLSLKFQTHNFLLVSAISVLVAIIIQNAIGKQFINDRIEHIERSENEKSLFTVFSEDPYIRTMAIFTALSVLTALFIQYLFMAVTRNQYPAVEEMAGFLGLFSGGMMMVVLLVKRVVLPYVLHNFNLRTCLIISPVLITVFAAIVIVIGLTLGYTTGVTGAFIIFFLFLAINRVVSKSLKESIETYSFKVLYQSIDTNIRSRLKSVMTGKVNEIAVIFSGLILTCLGLFSSIKLIHFSFLLILVSLIWIYVAFRLFKEYRNSLIKAIKQSDQPENYFLDKQDVFKNRFSARIAFRQDYFSLISGDHSALNRTMNKWYYENIIDYAYSKKDINLLPVLKKTSVNNRLDEGVRQHSAEVAGILQKNSSSFIPDDEKISEALKILSGTRMPQTTEILRLLRDNSLESKRLAIFMIGKFQLSDLLSEVCECLNNPGVAVDAYEVLKVFRADIEDDLVRFYLIKSGNIRLSKTILRLLGRSYKKETIGFLFARLWSSSRQLKEIVVKYLINCKFNPSEEEKQQLNQLASEVIGIITWNLSAKISLENDHDSFLLEKIQREIQRWNDFLFNILSITYNSGSIIRISENLAIGTTESVIYALEMIELVVSDPVKSKLISLLNVVPDVDKLKKLYRFFPGEIPEHKKLLEDIINRDYNLISLWTKACTLRSITRIEGDNMAESVTALLFSPEEIIQEESANLIARSKPEIYTSASPRLSDSTRKRLDKIINGTIDKKELLFGKVEFLSKYFMGIPEDDLVPLAGEMKFIKNYEEEFTGFSDGCIIWPLSDVAKTAEIHILYDGEIDKLISRYKDMHNLSFYFLPLIAVEEYNFQFPYRSLEILKYIDNNEE